MKSNKTIDEITVKFIDENQDHELNDRVAEAILKATCDATGKGDTKKVLCALADFTASFLKMCAENNTGKEPMKAEDFFDIYTDILDIYCFAYDHPEKNG